jgi:hypothetical protein
MHETNELPTKALLYVSFKYTLLSLNYFRVCAERRGPALRVCDLKIMMVSVKSTVFY